jgi:hypothetical protein
LVFKVGSVAPTIDLNCKDICPFDKVVGDIELSWAFAVFGISNPVAVNPDPKSTVNAIETEANALPIKGCWNSEKFPVAGCRIVALIHNGWLRGKRICDVGVDWNSKPVKFNT